MHNYPCLRNMLQMRPYELPPRTCLTARNDRPHAFPPLKGSRSGPNAHYRQRNCGVNRLASDERLALTKNSSEMGIAVDGG